VVAAGDGEALRDAIATYLDDPARLAAQAGRCRDHVAAHFSLEREAGAISEVYDALGGKPG